VLRAGLAPNVCHDQPSPNVVARVVCERTVSLRPSGVSPQRLQLGRRTVFGVRLANSAQRNALAGGARSIAQPRRICSRVRSKRCSGWRSRLVPGTVGNSIELGVWCAEDSERWTQPVKTSSAKSSSIDASRYSITSMAETASWSLHTDSACATPAISNATTSRSSPTIPMLLSTCQVLPSRLTCRPRGVPPRSWHCSMPTTRRLSHS
jgi:hypothetical protein